MHVLRRTITPWTWALSVLLTLAACSSPQGDGGPPPRGGPPAGTPPGTLVAVGTGYVHTFDVSSGTQWSERLSYSAPWSTETVHQPGNELLIANTSGSNPVIVAVYDLATFGLKHSFEWPDSTSMTSLYALGASHDGAHLAITMSALGDPFLEVIEVATGDIVFTGFSDAVVSNLVWDADDKLYVALDLGFEGDTARWGAIVAFPLANLAAATGGSVQGFELAAFTRAEWDDGVSGLALSADGSQLLFERAGDLWVIDIGPGAEPHQLTTGPTSNHGGVFSPTGSHIAFATGGGLGLDETYIIPNHRQAPLFIDHGQGAGDQYLLEAETLVDYMAAWLP